MRTLQKLVDVDKIWQGVCFDLERIFLVGHVKIPEASGAA